MNKPRILFLGNIAQNGYLLTKFLREGGSPADLLIYNYTHLMGQPEWEDAEIRGNPPHCGADWSEYVADDYRRPQWVHEVRPPQRSLAQRILARSRVPGLVRRIRAWSRLRPYRFSWMGNVLSKQQREQLLEKSRQCPTVNGPIRPEDIDRILMHCSSPGIPLDLVQRSDVLIGAGLEAVLPMVLAPEKPRIAFEHGTMREFPFEDSSWGRMLAFAYTQADACIITNPDCLASAKKLGLTNYRFMPHPVDYKHTAPAAPSSLRRRLQIGDRPLLFAPARHDWDIKANQELIRGFADFVASTGNRDARLLLLQWGNDIRKSRSLLRKLNVSDQVIWQPVMSGKAFCDALRSSDVVLDQFGLGVFGSTVPQALAAGKPVITSYDPDKNDWAFPVAAPLFRASTAKEIAEHLRQLVGDVEKRQAAGLASSRWFEKYHSPARVAGILEEIIESVRSEQGSRRGNRLAAAPPERASQRHCA